MPPSDRPVFGTVAALMPCKHTADLGWQGLHSWQRWDREGLPTRAMVPAFRKLLRRTLPSRFTLFRTTRRFFSSLVSWFPVIRLPFLFFIPSNT